MARVEHGRTVADRGVNSDLDDRTFARAPGVLWRTLSDRVLLHQVRAEPDRAGMELQGRAALVWVALDEPATAEEVLDRLVDAGIELQAPGPSSSGLDALAGDLQRLVEAGVVAVQETDGQPEAG